MAAKRARRTLTLGRRSFSLEAGRPRLVAVKLSRRGRRIVEKNGRLRARATLRAKTRPAVKSGTGSKTLTIKAPRRKR
jgi:hypothetical protein